MCESVVKACHRLYDNQAPKPSQTLKFIHTFEILAFKLFSICASFNMSKVNISLCLTLDVGTP